MRILLAGLALLSLAAVPGSTVDGVWQTDGYGQLVAVSGGREAFHHVAPLQPAEDRDLGTIMLKERKE